MEAAMRVAGWRAEKCIRTNGGHKVPHVVGQMCNEKTCPKCRTAMTTE